MAVTNDPKETLKALDSDKDGHINANELKKHTAYVSLSSDSGFNATLTFAKLDLNNNGFIELTEIDSDLVEG
jgi:hypothetical protein